MGAKREESDEQELRMGCRRVFRSQMKKKNTRKRGVEEWDVVGDNNGVQRQETV